MAFMFWSNYNTQVSWQKFSFILLFHQALKSQLSTINTCIIIVHNWRFDFIGKLYCALTRYTIHSRKYVTSTSLYNNPTNLASWFYD